MTNIQTVVSNVETSVFEKMTKAEKFEFIADIFSSKKQEIGIEEQQLVEMVAFLQKEQGLVEKKNAKRSAKKSETQLENDAIRQQVLEFFETKEENDTFVAEQIFAEIGKQDFTPQKMTAILKPLVDNETLEKVPNVQVIQKVGDKEKKTRKMGYKLA